ncbi:mediator of RNA polymerase II transcription subunit 15a [Olea europaea var. sylvestris]|uniref:mediator of RNA polymerase II transcription subunit 15a n=1 Tax=Olea europaea var. sylvestris TaxID=158386 RepID=UPI000C1CEDDF|nr:mediator of RNA polymerase II transcription subunit 15a [Olea europaea var. sylvestris]
MGVSFKVSKTGKRFRPKPLASDTPVGGGEEEDILVSSSINKSDPHLSSTRNLTVEAGKNDGATEISDNDISFTLSLFPDGYSVGKPVENESGHQTAVDVPKFLHSYDRASETLFSAIESGRLPGDLLDDIPCKYIEGTLVCEVRDYRKCSSEAGVPVASGDALPSIHRVQLRMSLENVVKDIPSISDHGWTYGDLMEVEARIMKALKPQLCLDPSPKLDKLNDNPVFTKLNLAVHSMRRKRLRQIREATVSSNNKINGKRVCIDGVPESSRLGDWGSLMQQSIHENLNVQNNVSSAMFPLRTNSFGSDVSISASSLVSPQSKYQMGFGSPSLLQDQRSGAPLNASIASPAGQDMISLTDNGASSVHGKRENDGLPSPLFSKRGRLTATGVDGSQHVAQQMDSFNGPDSHWKTASTQQQPVARGIQYTSNSMKKFSQQMFEGGLNQDVGSMPFTSGQQGMRYGLKEEPVETERLDKTDISRIHMAESEITHIDQSRLQQRMPQQFGRAGFPQTPCNSLGQPLENNSRKEDTFQKRKLVQSPRISAGGLPQSPLSSKSGEFSSSSMGPQFGGVVTSGFVSSQKEKSAVTSIPAIGVAGTMSLTSSANDSMQRQNQAQAAAKHRSNSLTKTAAISGVGSPASVSNMNAMVNANSPVGNQLAEQPMMERFSKIKMVTSRYQLNSKKNKVDQYPIRKPQTYSAQQLALHLSNDSNNENLKDEMCKMPLSRSLVGGNMNVPKTRILNFVQTERILQGNGFQLVPKARTRMIMSEKPNDGSVAIHIGEIEDAEYLAAEDHLPTLPNTHIADLLAEQFCLLMIREGYHPQDHVQPKPVRINQASTSQLNVRETGSTPVEMQQYSDGVSSLPSNDIAKTSNSGNLLVSSSQNIQGPPMVSPPGNAQVMQISQGLLPGVSMTSRPQQPELQPSLQQQPSPPPPHQQSLMQQQNLQYQRSPMMFSPNSMPHLNTIGQNANMQLGANMANKSSSLQLQLMQQQQQQQQLQPQQQQHPQMQRKIIGGLGTVGMGNIGNNMVGLGSLNNVMGMRGIRGVGGSGISSPMGSLSNTGNMTQNQMNLAQASHLSNALRSGTLTPAQAAFVANLRSDRNRSNMLGPQASIGGMAGGRQMNPGSSGLSMLGPSLNRANISQIQRTAVGAMGPPKMIQGMNLYTNQQLQQQQHQQQQQQLQLQQMQIQQQQNQQLQQQQQQESTSPLQAVLSPPQVGSPSSMGIPHHMNQNQQQQQQQEASPQQISQRTQISPQLSSGAIHPISAGNSETCPASPQVSSQTMGSVGSIANSSMELQGVNKNNSVGNA